MKINRGYLFERIKITSHNRMAVAAAQSVTSGGIYSFNPLYIYGPSGVGKTYLLHAIANRAEQKNPDAVIQIVSAKALAASLREAKDLEEFEYFKDQYTNADYLLIDDLHELEDPKDLEEITLITAHMKVDGHNVVFTSNCAPKELPAVNEHFLRFLNYGFVADIVAEK